MTDSIRDGYDASWLGHAHQHADLYAAGIGRLAAAVPLVQGGDSLLDIGCGDGALARILRPQFREVCGVDISETAVELARRAGIDAARIDIDRERLPYRDAAFDFVTCLDVIEHVYDPVRLLAECHRVTKSGGLVLITTVNMRYLRFMLILLVRGRFPKTSRDTTLYDGGHLHYFTSRDIVELLRAAGFEPLRRKGVIGTRRLRGLRRLTEFAPVREFLSTGSAVLARKTR